MKLLIVNADDCNLTNGVSEAILDCHDRGIVTSTSFLINLPAQAGLIRQLKRRKRLGVGLHLNITLGRPLSRPEKISSLLQESDFFKRQISATPPKSGEVAREYEAQIRRFRKIFGRLPTHLDTHHQLHDRKNILKVLLALASRYRLPIRHSKLSSPRRGKVKKEKVTVTKSDSHLWGQTFSTTDFLFGNLNPAKYWTRSSLEKTLRTLPDGVSEIMCHPGYCDSALRQISSMQEARGKEHKLFSSKRFAALVSVLRIKLINFSQI